MFLNSDHIAFMFALAATAYLLALTVLAV